MNTPKVKLSDFDKNKENPFVPDVVREVHLSKRYKNSSNTHLSGNRAILQTIDSKGKMIGHVAFITQHEISKEMLMKVYLRELQLFWDLPTSAIKVLEYVLCNVNHDLYHVNFFLDDCKLFTGYSSKNQIFTGLATLIDTEILARGYHEHIYFVNPLIVNGQGVSFIKTYIVKN